MTLCIQDGIFTKSLPISHEDIFIFMLIAGKEIVGFDYDLKSVNSMHVRERYLRPKTLAQICFDEEPHPSRYYDYSNEFLEVLNILTLKLFNMR